MGIMARGAQPADLPAGAVVQLAGCLQMTADYGLFAVSIAEAGGGPFGPLAETAGVFVPHDRRGGAKGAVVPPRGGAGGGCFVAVEALTCSGAVFVDPTPVSLGHVTHAVATFAGLGLFEIRSVVGPVEGHVAAGDSGYFGTMGVVAVEAFDVAGAGSATGDWDSGIVAGGTAPPTLICCGIPVGRKCLDNGVFFARRRIGGGVVFAPARGSLLLVTGGNAPFIPCILSRSLTVTERLRIIVLVTVAGNADQGYLGNFGSLSGSPHVAGQEVYCGAVQLVGGGTYPRSPDNQLDRSIFDGAVVFVVVSLMVPYVDQPQ